MENIKLSELLDAILAFKHDPTEENDAKVQALLGKLQIVSYLNLTKKMLAATKICINIWDDNKDAIHSGITLEINELLYGLLEYAINLENDLGYFQSLDLIYNTLCEYGFDDYLLKFCEKDFKRLQRLVDRVYNFGNVYRIEKTAEMFTPESLAQFASTLKDTVSSLTPEMLADLKSVANAASPEWQAFKETTADEVIDKTLYSELDKNVKEFKSSKKLEKDFKEEK